MMACRFGWVSILVVVFLTGLRADFVARADDGHPMKRWVLGEGHDDGSRTLTVIDEDLAYHDDPTVLSQHVVLKQKFPAGDLTAFAEAKARFEREAPSDRRDFVRDSRRAKPLWVAVKDEWTEEDEDDYSAWFSANVRKDFLKGTGLLADCADVGLIFRWVYARDHRLPIANTLSGSGKLFGNFTRSAAWDKLPTDPDWRRDERFKAAMRDLFDETYTWTINGDQYPTVISPKYVRPGSMYMIIRAVSGHTQTIDSVSDSSGITTLWGNEPAAESIYGWGLIVEFENRRGFQSWRHVRRSFVNGTETWRLIPGVEMKGYSREQFDAAPAHDEEAWMDWIYARLGSNFGVADRYLQAVGDFMDAVDYRLETTGIGSLFCGPDSPCAPSSSEYGNYSTFSRDARMKTLRQEIRGLVAKLGPTHPVVTKTQADLDQDGEVVAGSGIGYRDAIEKDGVLESWSSNPNDSYLARWGVPDAVASLRTRFLMLSIASHEHLLYRESQIEDAVDCRKSGCDDETAKSYDTSVIDGRMRGEFAEIGNLGGDSSISASDRERIRARYRQVDLAYLDPKACGHSVEACTADDVIWADGADARLAKWTSGARDPVTARWGF